LWGQQDPSYANQTPVNATMILLVFGAAVIIPNSELTDFRSTWVEPFAKLSHLRFHQVSVQRIEKHAPDAACTRFYSVAARLDNTTQIYQVLRAIAARLLSLSEVVPRILVCMILGLIV
jgi:hypothetical protein